MSLMEFVRDGQAQSPMITGGQSIYSRAGTFMATTAKYLKTFPFGNNGAGFPSTGHLGDITLGDLKNTETQKNGHFTKKWPLLKLVAGLGFEPRTFRL